MNINRNESWRPYSLSSNYAIDPLFGAIHVFISPESINLYKKSIDKYYPLISCISDNSLNSSISSEDIYNSKYNFESDSNKEYIIINEYFINNKSFYNIDKTNIEDIKKETKKILESYNDTWKSINLKKDIPILVRIGRFEDLTAIENQNKKHGFRYLKNKIGPFSLVFNVTDNRNFIFKITNEDLSNISLLEFNSRISSFYPPNTITGDEYLFISDRDWTSWSIKFKDAIDQLNINDSESSLLNIFKNEIKEENYIDSFFEFKPLSEDSPIVPYGSEDNNALGINKFYTSIDFTYSDQFPLIEVEDLNKNKSNDFNIDYEIGEPSIKDGVKIVTIKIRYNPCFTSSKDVVTIKDKEYITFNSKSFIELKVSCKSAYNPLLSKECFIVLQGDYKSPQDKIVTIKILEEKHYNYKSGRLIELPKVDKFNSSVVGFMPMNSTTKELEYKDNFEVSRIDSDNQLYGYTWNNIFNPINNIKFFNEVNNVSSLPLLNKKSLIYFNEDNNSYFKYNLKGSFSNKFINNINEKYYSVVKIKEDCYDNFISGDVKLLGFSNDGFDSRISILDENLTELEIYKPEEELKSFIIPYGDAIYSKTNKNEIKIVCLVTKSNDFIKKDDSFFDLKKYNSSIGNICNITLNTLLKTFKVTTLVECKSQKIGSERKSIVYIPLTLNPEYIRNGDKNYIFKTINSSFLKNTIITEFYNSINTYLWGVPCEEVEITQNDKDRSVIFRSNGVCSLFLSNLTRNTLEEGKNKFYTDEFSLLKDESINKSYFSIFNSGEIYSFNGDTLSFSSERYDAENTISKMFPLINNGIENIAILKSNGEISLKSDKNNILFNIGAVNGIPFKVEYLNGICNYGSSLTNKTECVLFNTIGVKCIYKLYNNTLSELAGLDQLKDIIDIKDINGILFALVKNGEELDIYNLGNLHPKY